MIRNWSAAARGLVQSAAMVAVAAGIGVWGVILLAPRPAAPPPALTTAAPPSADTGPVAAWFGAGPAVRVQVVSSGLIAAGDRSSAILAVDGARPRAFGVGDTLGRDLVLTEVRRDGVMVRQGGQSSLVAVPTLPPPTGITRVGDMR